MNVVQQQILLAKTIRNDRRAKDAPRPPLSAARLLKSIRPDLSRPVFVLGSPRSGTTFLGNALGRVPGISYHNEPPATSAAARLVYSGEWDWQRAARYYRRTYRWLMRARGEGDHRFCEKTPRNNFIVPFLADAFPDARFLHILRDGRDAALSHMKKPWLAERMREQRRIGVAGDPLGPFPRFWVERERAGEFGSTDDYHRCIWTWRRHVEAALADGAALGAERYLELRYEDVVREPAAGADRIADFLDLTAPQRSALTASLGRARDDSVGAWRRELSGEQVARSGAEAGPLLRRLGYEEP